MAKMNEKEDIKQDKKTADAEIKKAFKQHDKQEHKGEHTKLKLKKGGLDKVKKMAKGGVTQSNLRSMGRNMARIANQRGR